MNVFVLDLDIKKCASYHCDKHIVKMILEYAQLLSTAHRVLDGKQKTILSKSGRKQKIWVLEDKISEKNLYQAVSVNHPCGIWVRQSKANYTWLHTLLTECLFEYYDRYEKEHKTSRILLDLFPAPNNIPDGPLSEFPQAMPDECKVVGDPVKAYRNYYNMHKHRFAKWKNGNTPEWYSPVI